MADDRGWEVSVGQNRESFSFGFGLPVVVVPLFLQALGLRAQVLANEDRSPQLPGVARRSIPVRRTRQPRQDHPKAAVTGLSVAMDVVSGHVLQVQLLVQESLHLDGLLSGLPVRLLQPVSAQIAPPAAVVSTAGAALQIFGRSSEAADVAASHSRLPRSASTSSISR